MAIGNGQAEFENGTQPEGSPDFQDDVKCDRNKPVVHGHPALLRWTPPRNHNLSPTQFESLKSIADTFVPSLPPPFKAGEEFELMPGVTAEDVARFYKLKASDEDIINVVRFVMNLRSFIHRNHSGSQKIESNCDNMITKKRILN